MSLRYLLVLGLLCVGEALADASKAVEAYQAGDYAEAERQARAAIAKGDGRGYEILAGLHMARQDQPQDVEAAIATLQEGRKAGYLRANVVLAELLRTLGRTGKPGEDEPAALMLEAAERGYPPAQYFIAKDLELLFMAYERAEDRAAGLRWYREAAKAPAAALEMETISVTGQHQFCDVAWRIENSLKSAPDALAWYRHCAEAGCGEGMHKLVQIYRQSDPPLAARWEQAAKSAKPEACLNQ